MRHPWPAALLLLLLSACATVAPGDLMASAADTHPGTLPDLGPAPELSNRVWMNTDRPLRLAELRGKVVGLEMWTFDCINCQHVIPQLRAMYARFKDDGFVLIGNHFPEFSHEAEAGNLKKAIEREGVTYPVAQDNDGRTWQAYHNQYWPTLYLIDKRGHIRYVHIGEGAYDEIEANIRALLAEKASDQ